MMPHARVSEPVDSAKLLPDTQRASTARLHRQRTGTWPHADSGPIIDASGETWKAVAMVLHFELRGIRKRTSLARLLKAERADEDGQ